MSKARLYGQKKAYIPNSKADLRYRQKAFQLGKKKTEAAYAKKRNG